MISLDITIPKFKSQMDVPFVKNDMFPVRYAL